MTDPTGSDRSVRPRSHHWLIFLAELICSDDDCELTLEAVGDLTELELLVCEDCGCCLQAVSLSAHEVVALPERLELARAA